LIDKGRHINLVDFQSSRRVDLDTNHYLVVVKFRERLLVRKRAATKF